MRIRTLVWLQTIRWSLVSLNRNLSCSRLRNTLQFQFIQSLFRKSLLKDYYGIHVIWSHVYVVLTWRGDVSTTEFIYWKIWKKQTIWNTSIDLTFFVGTANVLHHSRSSLHYVVSTLILLQDDIDYITTWAKNLKYTYCTPEMKKIRQNQICWILLLLVSMVS